jgi:predicted transcriptional regulator of viral defense system/very-short-patch-repair endonuclease
MADETRLELDSSVQLASRSVDKSIAALARQQHGIISRLQLADLGLDRNAIQYRLAVGRLHQVHRGVYAVGHGLLSRSGKCFAAVAACGRDAVLSHRSAGWLWGLRSDDRAGIEVTAPRFARRSAIHCRVSRLPEDERTARDGIPITTVPRTLLDLAAVLRPHQLERAIEQAEVLRLTDPLSLPAVLQRYPGRRGTATLRRLLADGRLGATVTRSELEERFLEFVAETRLPPPEVNAWLQVDSQWIEVDCLWRVQRVALELDGRGAHGTRAAFERDRYRDRRLHVGGWTPIRVTWRQLATDASELESDLRALLTT